MRTFTDPQGDKWNITINVASLKKCKEAGYDLLDMGATGGFNKVASDPVELFSVLFILVKKQAEDRKLSFDSFAERFTGDAVEAASDAFMEEYTDFFPSQRKVVFKKIIEKAKKEMQAQLEKAAEEISGQQSGEPQQ